MGLTLLMVSVEVSLCFRVELSIHMIVMAFLHDGAGFGTFCQSGCVESA